MFCRVERTQQLFGRVLPEHIAAEQKRVRSDALIDSCHLSDANIERSASSADSTARPTRKGTIQPTVLRAHSVYDGCAG